MIILYLVAKCQLSFLTKKLFSFVTIAILTNPPSCRPPSWAHKYPFVDALIFIFRNTYALYIHVNFLSVKKNAFFLRIPPLAYLIISVCQILYNLREYVRVMKDIITDFSCVSCTAYLYYVMCWA